MKESAHLLERILSGKSLTEDEAAACMRNVLDGDADPAWTAGWLVALRARGETVEEITGFARTMRACATPIVCTKGPLVDTCGTGGDGSGTFNISTTAAFVVAGAGAFVAKHGNRSVSSRCGSADVLEALGARLDLEPSRVAQCVDQVGFGFLFAPALHGAMRHAMGPRRALGVRTVFNILGPLTNPAGAPHQVMGVFSETLLIPLAHVMKKLGNGRSLLVHGHDGLDELTVTGVSSFVTTDEPDVVQELDPSQFGLGQHDSAALAGGDARENAAITRAVLAGQTGAPRDIVVLNAAAALWAAGIAADLAAGVEAAAAAIDSGAAAKSLENYVEFTRSES